MNPIKAFTDFVENLILGLVKQFDTQTQLLKAELANVSDMAAKLSTENQELKAAIAASDQAKTVALSEQSAQTAAELDAATTRLLELVPNPTPGADLVENAIVETPLVEAVVENSVENGTPEPTPVGNVEEAVSELGAAIQEAATVEST